MRHWLITLFTQPCFAIWKSSRTDLCCRLIFDFWCWHIKLFIAIMYGHCGSSWELYVDLETTTDFNHLWRFYHERLSTNANWKLPRTVCRIWISVGVRSRTSNLHSMWEMESCKIVLDWFQKVNWVQSGKFTNYGFCGSFTNVNEILPHKKLCRNLSLGMNIATRKPSCFGIYIWKYVGHLFCLPRIWIVCWVLDSTGESSRILYVIRRWQFLIGKCTLCWTFDGFEHSVNYNLKPQMLKFWYIVYLFVCKCLHAWENVWKIYMYLKVCARNVHAKCLLDLKNARVSCKLKMMVCCEKKNFTNL